MAQRDTSAEIIAVGSEILLGQIVNTNASYLSRGLSKIGVDLFRQSVVGDNPKRLSSALIDSLERSDIVITSGGLGPTVDDITMAAIADVISSPILLDKTIWASIKSFFRKRHIRMPQYVSKQAMLPKGAVSVKNTVGTAPGAIIPFGDKTIVALPGPPRELGPIFEKAVVPYLKRRYRLRSTIVTRSVRTTGLPESYVNKRIRKFLMMKGKVTVGIYARPYEVDVKITAKARDRKKALFDIKNVERDITRILNGSVFGFDDDTLERIVGKRLKARRMRLSAVESCTGGLISHRITSIPGSSRYFDRSIITYSNGSKIKELGVKSELIYRHGAVSRQVAVAMAKGMLKKSGSDAAIAVSGIAGPGGGTKKKPVGLVYIAVAMSGKTRCIERHFIGNRADIKYQTSTAALELLRKSLI